MPVKFQPNTEYRNRFKEPQKLWDKELTHQTVAGVPSVQLGPTLWKELSEKIGNTHSEYNQQFHHGLDLCDPPLPDFYKLPSQQKIASQKNGVTHEPPLQHKKKADSSMEHLPHKYMCLEPPLQRKKKPIQPHGSKSVGMNENSDEYVLLGSQKKFAPNVVYKAKPQVSISQEVNDVRDEEPTSTPMAPRLDPPPRVVVDTGAPKHLRKSDKQLENTQKQNRESEKYHSRNVTNQDNYSRQQNRDPDRQEAYTRLQVKDSNKHSATKENKISSKKQPQDYVWSNAKKSAPKPQQSAEEPKPRAKSAIMKSSEHIQNGDLAPEEQAPFDYALKYKAGVAPPRGQGPKRLSEYQRQFAWKQGVGSSPLLDAEQVVYKSSTQIIPRKAKFNKTTEYRREFQPWQSLTGTATAMPSKPSSSISAKHKIQRSKSVEALSPDKRQPAGKEKVTSEVDPRLVQESLNPLRPYFPHGPYRTYSSEYAANFAPPQVYEYEEGAWKGANPPHLQTNQVQTKENKPTKKASKSEQSEDRPKSSPVKATNDSQGNNAANSWFMEVIELRRRAEEYKRRAQGTHFSRQHLVQLLAEQAEMWDTASTSSMLSALSLEHPNMDRSQKLASRKKSSPSKDLVDVPPAGKKTAWGNDREPASSRATDESARSASIVTTFDTQSVQNDLSEAPTLVGDEEAEKASDSITAGRIPTPKMPPTGLRHHLDRTTPLQGGALLSSPSNNRAASMNNLRRKVSSSAESLTTTSTSRDIHDGARQPPTSESPSISQVCCTCGVESDSQDVSISHKKLDKVVQTELAPSGYQSPVQDTSGIQHHKDDFQVKQLLSAEKELVLGKDHSKHHNDKHVGSRQLSPTWDSRQFQHAMKVLGDQQQKLMEEAKQSQANIEHVREAKSKHRAKSMTSKKFKSLPRHHRVPSNENNVTSDSVKDIQTESCLYPGGFDEQAELSLAERLEKQIQITEGLCQTSKSVNKLVKPLYGMPTRDTHVLVDETASVDRPLVTDYVDTPIKHVKHNRDKFPDVDVPSTIQEDTADTKLSKLRTSSGIMTKSAQNEVTLGDIQQRPVDDDVLSMSMRSVASSCSLASEVLQRARDRRDQFWGVSGRA